MNQKRITAMNDSKPRVIAVVTGGVVTEIFSDCPLRADVLDDDSWKVTPRKTAPDQFAALQQEIEEGQLQPRM